MSDNDEVEKFPVFLCAPGEEENEKPIGYADSKGKAARIIRSETGDNDYRSSDVTFSWHRKAFFSE